MKESDEGKRISGDFEEPEYTRLKAQKQRIEGRLGTYDPRTHVIVEREDMEAERAALLNSRQRSHSTTRLLHALTFWLGGSGKRHPDSSLSAPAPVPQRALDPVFDNTEELPRAPSTSVTPE